MKKRYRVSGGHSVLGHAPGEEFEADLEAEGVVEEPLLEAGHLELVGKSKPEPEKEQ